MTPSMRSSIVTKGRLWPGRLQRRFCKDNAVGLDRQATAAEFMSSAIGIGNDVPRCRWSRPVQLKCPSVTEPEPLVGVCITQCTDNSPRLCGANHQCSVSVGAASRSSIKPLTVRVR
jgi:hypothetical protein